MPKIRRYNWLPDLPDQRDYMFSLQIPEKLPKRLPSQKDLRDQCSTIFDQGKIGSCTGNALAGAIEFLELLQLNDSIDDVGQSEIFSPQNFEPVSRLFIYYNERFLEGHVKQDAGATLRDGIKALVQWGVCPESAWNYEISNLYAKPSARCYKEAKSHSISNYFRLETLTDMRQCLANGFPFTLGFMVYESFESPQIAKTGIMPMPSLQERAVGGHAVLVVGYNDRSKHLIVRNSWGKKWGQDGYFMMPYAYVENPRLAQDFWTVRQ